MASARMAAAVACAASAASGCCSSSLCENETRKEYGKNSYARFAKDPEYRDAVWNAFFTAQGNTEGPYSPEGSSTNTASREWRKEHVTPGGGLSITCEELLSAARKGLGLKRALKLIHMTGQNDMVRSQCLKPPR